MEKKLDKLSSEEVERLTNFGTITDGEVKLVKESLRRYATLPEDFTINVQILPEGFVIATRTVPVY